MKTACDVDYLVCFLVANGKRGQQLRIRKTTSLLLSQLYRKFPMRLSIQCKNNSSISMLIQDSERRRTKPIAWPLKDKVKRIKVCKESGF